MGMVPGGYTVNHYLTDTDAFITTDVPNGMKHMERAPLTTKWKATLILAMLDTKLEKDTYLAYQTLGNLRILGA